MGRPAGACAHAAGVCASSRQTRALIFTDRDVQCAGPGVSLQGCGMKWMVKQATAPSSNKALSAPMLAPGQCGRALDRARGRAMLCRGGVGCWCAMVKSPCRRRGQRGKALRSVQRRMGCAESCASLPLPSASVAEEFSAHLLHVAPRWRRIGGFLFLTCPSRCGGAGQVVPSHTTACTPFRGHALLPLFVGDAQAGDALGGEASLRSCVQKLGAPPIGASIAQRRWTLGGGGSARFRCCHRPYQQAIIFKASSGRKDAERPLGNMFLVSLEIWQHALPAFNAFIPGLQLGAQHFRYLHVCNVQAKAMTRARAPPCVLLAHWLSGVSAQRK